MSVNIRNLQKLARYLENNITDDQLDMSNFRSEMKPSDDSMGACSFYAMNQCGTAGCALGWAPFAIPPKPEHYEKSRNIKAKPIARLDFARYCVDTFGGKWNDAPLCYIFDPSTYENEDITVADVVFRIHAVIAEMAAVGATLSGGFIDRVLSFIKS